MNIKKFLHERYYFIITIMFIGVFTFCLLQSKKEIVIQTSTDAIDSISQMSNKKIGWGIKRNDNHEQPDLGSVNKKVLEDNQGIAMGNKDSKNIYLTFDEGYEAGYTPKILEVLKNNNVTATFFLTAHYINTQPELVQEMINAGHTIGNHTVNHKSMPTLSLEEMKKEVMELHTAVYQKFGYEMKYIRPPKGEYSEKSVAYCNTLGYTTVMWSFAYDDWDENHQKGENYAKEKIIKNIHNGAVILLHGNSKDNTNVLDSCIKEIKNMGYEFKSLDEFVK